MPVSEVHHVAMTVSDVDRAADFYERALGYRRTLRTDVGGPGIEVSLRAARRAPPAASSTCRAPAGSASWNSSSGTAPRPAPRPPVTSELGTFLLSFEVPVDEMATCTGG